MEEAQVPWFDLPERELRKYRTTTAEPDGLDAWWDNQLAHARAKASPSTLRRYRPEAYGPAEVYDVEFSGAHGDVIRAWYICPPAAGRPTPLAVAFVGYGGGRGEVDPAVMNTLRYVDCALLARRIEAECLLSVGLMDETCPPSTVFAAYNEIVSAKEIIVYPFGVHDLPRAHLERRLRHLRERLLPNATAG
jgi:cephalosporin-C deacetylase-like acetyl esterase